MEESSVWSVGRYGKGFAVVADEVCKLAEEFTGAMDQGSVVADLYLAEVDDNVREIQILPNDQATA